MLRRGAMVAWWLGMSFGGIICRAVSRLLPAGPAWRSARTARPALTLLVNRELELDNGGMALTEAQVQLAQVGELGRTLAACASLAGDSPRYRDVVARIQRQFDALNRSAQASAARVDVSGDAADVDADGPLTVSDAAVALRAEARRVAADTTGVSAGLRRVAAVEHGAAAQPAGGHLREIPCSDCGELFTSSLGGRRCPGCAQRREQRRAEDLDRIRNRPKPTTLSAGWAELADEDAAATRRARRGTL